VLGAKRALSNPYAVGALVFSIVLQLLTVYVDPLAHILGLVPLASRDWLIIIAFALGPAVVGQVIKLGRRRR
jgi:magnesium-transporting ATPase (P-type)